MKELNLPEYEKEEKEQHKKDASLNHQLMGDEEDIEIGDYD